MLYTSTDFKGVSTLAILGTYKDSAIASATSTRANA